MIVLDDGIDRVAFREVMAAHGIQTSVHYPPVHRFGYVQSPAKLPHTESYGARTVTLPLFPHMSPAQQDFVIEGVTDALADGWAHRRGPSIA